MFLRTRLDGDLGHREQRRQRHALGNVIVICHGPCADERETIAGTVDRDVLCSGGVLGRTDNRT